MLARYSSSYDWAQISSVAHGIGANSRYVVDSIKDEDGYSTFVSEMHEL